MAQGADLSVCGCIKLLAAIGAPRTHAEAMYHADLMLKERNLPGIVTTCLNCGKGMNLMIKWAKYAKTRERGFCGPRCSKAWHQIELVCTGCGCTFYRPKSVILRQRRLGFNENGYFCTIPCWRTWQKQGKQQMRPRTHIGHEFYLGI